MMKSLKITDGKGIHISFANNWILSIQFGPGNYGSNHDLTFRYRRDAPIPDYEATTVEIAIINPAGKMIAFPEGDTVRGYVPVSELPSIISEIAIR